MTPFADHDFGAAHLAIHGHDQPVPPPDSHAPHDARGTGSNSEARKRSQPTASACHCPVCGNACVTRHAEAVEAARAEGRARIITLCGSTRFKSDFESWNSRLTLDGNVVISVGVFGHGYHPYHREKYLDPKKPMLDRLHLQKVDMADEVFVIDPGGYVGDSTRREIEHARETGKPVTFLSQLDPDCGTCGLDNRNGTHSAMERTGRLSHRFEPAPLPDNHPALGDPR